MINELDDISLRFPAILKEKIASGEFRFPSGTEFCYTPIKAFRCVEREKDDNNIITRNDFKSYAELGRKKTRGKIIDIHRPEYYGVSLFRKKEIVENIMKFPNPHKKMAVGYVVQEYGPQLTNYETEHVCWWLYENVDLKDFIIIAEGKDDE